jgi:hypothetical protein
MKKQYEGQLKTFMGGREGTVGKSCGCGDAEQFIEWPQSPRQWLGESPQTIVPLNDGVGSVCCHPISGRLRSAYSGREHGQVTASSFTSSFS